MSTRRTPVLFEAAGAEAAAVLDGRRGDVGPDGAYSAIVGAAVDYIDHTMPGCSPSPEGPTGKLRVLFGAKTTGAP
jgi:hypothetical protein